MRIWTNKKFLMTCQDRLEVILISRTVSCTPAFKQSVMRTKRAQCQHSTTTTERHLTYDPYCTPWQMKPHFLHAIWSQASKSIEMARRLKCVNIQPPPALLRSSDKQHSTRLPLNEHQHSAAQIHPRDRCVGSDKLQWEQHTTEQVLYEALQRQSPAETTT